MSREDNEFNDNCAFFLRMYMSTRNIKKLVIRFSECRNEKLGQLNIMPESIDGDVCVIAELIKDENGKHD